MTTPLPEITPPNVAASERLKANVALLTMSPAIDPVSRAFRSLYKMTPSEVRAAARSEFLSTHHAPQSGDASFGMLNRWLLGLDANGK